MTASARKGHRTWLLSILVVFVAVSLTWRSSEAAVQLCAGADEPLSASLEAVADNALFFSAGAPIVFIGGDEREALSRFTCHNAVLIQRLDGSTPKESAFAQLHIHDEPHGNKVMVRCDGDNCEFSGIADACVSTVAVSQRLADDIRLTPGDVVTLSKTTVVADLEYREVEVPGVNGKPPTMEKKSFVVPKHPVDTYRGAEENVYCREIPFDIHRLTQNVNMQNERPLPVVAEVMGILPGSYVHEIVLKYGQIAAMGLPAPYPYLTLASAEERERIADDVSIRMYDAPPYPEALVLQHVGELYKAEARIWLSDASTRGLHRPYFETIDGMPDDGVLITQATADKLGVAVGDFIIIKGTVSHDAYSYKKEIQHLKRKLEHEATGAH